MTEVQKIVVDARIKEGYTLLGQVTSLTNNLPAFMLCKGKHMLVINSLGYDEHFQGKTWKLIERKT